MRISDTIKIRFLQVLIAFDTFITILFWQLEANPIVTDMGKTVFVMVKMIMIIGIEIAWLNFNARKLTVGQIIIWLLVGFHLVVGLSNISVVLQL